MQRSQRARIYPDDARPECIASHSHVAYSYNSKNEDDRVDYKIFVVQCIGILVSSCWAESRCVPQIKVSNLLQVSRGNINVTDPDYLTCLIIECFSRIVLHLSRHGRKLITVLMND